ncbi:MAG: NADH-quinone oxidoreductase subunit L [Armatimonadetes bacterium]|nr:NADH-quinone oxidoreductase subunit L [Armatimonadota bacterium]
MDNSVFNLIWWVLGLPLLGFLIQCFFGKAVIDSMGVAKGKRVMGAIAVAAIGGAFAIGLMITQAMVAAPEGTRNSVKTLFSWIHTFGINIPFEFRIDPLSMTMVLVITGIGSLIHLYATGYMSEEKDYPRFFAYLNLFVAFMLVLVLGNNLPLLFIGWEGVGLCSYLLIGFWYKDLANSRAANKAFIVNRIGDVGLALGMFLIVCLVSSQKSALGITDSRWLSYDVLLPHLPKLLEAQPALATAIALCLFIGACGKSAQFPLYIWLPDAMAGPTPVSALIHAATMVTSGVVLLNRFSVVFQASSVASVIVVVIGLFTAIWAALIAFGQTDIKKVLAYSTVSQLGFMFIACGAGYYWVGMFHVITHAFFKALLFLGSGAVIHSMAHDQDMRNYGGLRKFIPITFWTMFIGHIAIAGVPFTSGWFSKEEIIHSSLHGHQAVINGVNVGMYAGWIAFGAALLTAIYMTRMMMLTFAGPSRWQEIPVASHDHDHHEHHDHAHHAHHDHGPDVHGFFYTDAELASKHEEHDHHHALDKDHVPHEAPISMWLPLVVLAFFSLIAGVWLKGHAMISGLPKNLLEGWLASGMPVHAEHAEGHGAAIPYQHLVEPLGYGIGLLGIVIGVIWYLKGLPQSEGWNLKKWSPFRLSAGNQFGYDQTMVDAGVDGGGALAEFMWKFVDNKVVDGTIVGLGKLTFGIGKLAGFFQTGKARGYALMMLTGVAAIAGYLIYALNQVGGKI